MLTQPTSLRVKCARFRTSRPATMALLTASRHLGRTTTIRSALTVRVSAASLVMILAHRRRPSPARGARLRASLSSPEVVLISGTEAGGASRPPFLLPLLPAASCPSRALPSALASRPPDTLPPALHPGAAVTLFHRALLGFQPPQRCHGNVVCFSRLWYNGCGWEGLRWQEVVEDPL